MQELIFVDTGLVRWREVPSPSLQKTGDALVRPIAATTCDLDRMMIQGKTPFKGPIAIGHEFVAEVVDVADPNSSLTLGNRYIVPAQISCGECQRCRRGLTGSCQSVPTSSMFGMGALTGNWGGGFSDLVRVPFASHALVPIPNDLRPSLIASAGENLSLSWEMVAPHLEDSPGADVLVLGSASIGLYSAAIAAAEHADRIDYVDSCADRLALAEALGANAIEIPSAEASAVSLRDATSAGPKRRRYDIVVEARGDAELLRQSLTLVQPGGICTTPMMYFKDVAFPLSKMFPTGVRFHTGRGHARPCIGPVMELVRSGRVRTDLVTSETLEWSTLPEALADPSLKPVFLRDGND